MSEVPVNPLTRNHADGSLASVLWLNCGRTFFARRSCFLARNRQLCFSIVSMPRVLRRGL